MINKLYLFFPQTYFAFILGSLIDFQDSKHIDGRYKDCLDFNIGTQNRCRESNHGKCSIKGQKKKSYFSFLSAQVNTLKSRAQSVITMIANSHWTFLNGNLMFSCPQAKNKFPWFYTSSMRPINIRYNSNKQGLCFPLIQQQICLILLSHVYILDQSTLYERFCTNSRQILLCLDLIRNTFN